MQGTYSAARHLPEIVMDHHGWAWALEQLKAGKRVKRQSGRMIWLVQPSPNYIRDVSGIAHISLQDLEAKDWIEAP